ncbi:MAG: DUF3696 domain-containing protein [Bacteroidales bacterium]|nr:DUF3696 domain-containing protein [Bacteroidales bacterium]
MIKSVFLERFKCFKQNTEIPLSAVTIMYGKNGRGKSTVSQSLLLLAQSMRKSNNLHELIINGDLVKLGSFEELLSNSEGDSFSIGINSDDENIVVQFSRAEGLPGAGRISRLNVNNEERLDIISGSGNSNGDDSLSGISPTSDVKLLQSIRNCMYVSADRNGPVNSQKKVFTSNHLLLDPLGDNVIQVIAQQDPPFLSRLRRALSEVMSGAHLSIPNTETDYLELRLNSSDGDISFKPVNVGFGYSYVLPVVVASLLAEKGSVLIVENPEAHLHPGAQSRLTKLLIDNAVSQEYQLIIESHSDHVVNGMRIAVKEGHIKPKSCLIDYFYTDSESGKASKEVITCDKNGTLSSYPDDFMDEWTLQLLQLV